MSVHHIKQISESEAVELQHDSYIMYIHEQGCTNCNCGERFSHLFEVWTHPTKTRTTGFRDLRQVASPQLKDLPIAVIELPNRPIPICSDCAASYDRPGLPPTLPVDRASWEATLKRKYAPEPARSAAPKPAARAVPTLDQL